MHAIVSTARFSGPQDNRGVLLRLNAPDFWQRAFLRERTCARAELAKRGSTTWSFSTPEGEISVNTSPVISSDDLAMILEATRNGSGVARLPSYVAAEVLESGDVVEVLPNLSVQDLWLKAMVPENRIHFPPCKALVNYVKEQLSAGIGLGV